MTILRRAAFGALIVAASATAAFAQDVTLRLHQFLPPQATIPAQILQPWIDRIREASGGRLEIQKFDAMALGGTVPELLDQAVDGAVDISLIVLGYTPGRFPRSEVFELPFMMTNAEDTSAAYWEFATTVGAEDFSDMHLLGIWVHGPGVIHSHTPIATTDDARGLTLRGPSRPVNQLIEQLGAQAIGMPLSQIPEALSRGVIDATVLPWEVTAAIHSSELVGNHTEFSGNHALYTATLALVMNQDSYNNLPDDLRAILDAESGQAFSRENGRITAENDAPARQIAVDRGNNIIQITEDQMGPWSAAAEPVIQGWISQATDGGLDGQALLDAANQLIEHYTNM